PVLVAEATSKSEQVRGEGDGERNRIFADATAPAWCPTCRSTNWRGGRRNKPRRRRAEAPDEDRYRWRHRPRSRSRRDGARLFVDVHRLSDTAGVGGPARSAGPRGDRARP